MGGDTIHGGGGTIHGGVLFTGGQYSLRHRTVAEA